MLVSQVRTNGCVGLDGETSLHKTHGSKDRPKRIEKTRAENPASSMLKSERRQTTSATTKGFDGRKQDVVLVHENQNIKNNISNN